MELSLGIALHPQTSAIQCVQIYKPCEGSDASDSRVTSSPRHLETGVASSPASPLRARDYTILYRTIVSVARGRIVTRLPLSFLA